MSISEIKDRVDSIYKDTVAADYFKEDYPVAIEDVVDRLGQCLDILNGM